MHHRVVHVSGLAENISDAQLFTLFGTYGIVAHAYVVRETCSGKSSGYGFVEMRSPEQALNAVVELEGTEFAGRCLRLSVTPYAMR